MTRIAAADIDLGVESAPSSGLARAVLFLFTVSIPLDVIPLFGTTSSIAYFAGMLLALAAVWQIASTGAFRSGPASLLLLTAYTAWALASVLWAHDTELALRRLSANVMLLAALWMGWQIARSRSDLRLMAAAYVIGCTIVSGGAWQAFLSGAAYGNYEERYSGMGYDPNDMGVTLAIAMPIAAYLALTGTRRRDHLWLAYLPVGLSAVALSGSRGATISSAVAILCIAAWIMRRSRIAALALVALLGAAVLVVAVRTPETLERVATMRRELSSGTIAERRTIWEAAFRLFGRNPLFGIGTGQFAQRIAPESGYPIEAHNAFISVLVELGVVGLALFAGAFACVLRGVWSKARQERMLVVAVLLTWLVGVSSLSWELKKATWFVVLLGSVAGALERDRAADGDELEDAA